MCHTETSSTALPGISEVKKDTGLFSLVLLLGLCVDTNEHIYIYNLTPENSDDNIPCSINYYKWIMLWIKVKSINNYLLQFEERCTSGIHCSWQLDVPNRSATKKRLTIPFSVELTVWALLFYREECPNPSCLHICHPPTHRAHLKQLQEAVFIDNICGCLMNRVGRFHSIKKTKISPKKINFHAATAKNKCRNVIHLIIKMFRFNIESLTSHLLIQSRLWLSHRDHS